MYPDTETNPPGVRQQGPPENEGLVDRDGMAAEEATVGLLTAAIAHDLNNLLFPIRGYAELMLAGPRMPGVSKDSEPLEAIIRAAGLAKDLTSELMALGRAGTFRPVTTAIKKVLEEAMTTVRLQVTESITLRYSAAAAIPPILADGSQLHWLFVNLLTNAVHAMPGGGNLSVSAVDEQVGPARDYWGRYIDGRFVVVRIADTGTGIEPEVMHRMFDPFFSTKPRSQGTGLGLFLVRKIIKTHGGFVTVRSRVSEGTEFAVYFQPAPVTATGGE